MADIFISYARPDRDKIEKLAAALEAEGYSVWWDREISGGAEFAQVIERELDAAKTVLVGWSAQSLGSHWVRDEADYARGKNKLLPLSLDGSLPPLGFRQIHALDFSGWDGEATHALFQELTRSLGSNSKSHSPAPGTSPENTPALVPGIALLPFDNMSNDEELGFLADGMVEDIITNLSTVKHLKIPPRTTVFAFRDDRTNLPAIGKALGVHYVAEGSLRKMGGRLRINVQLIATETGGHIWSQKYDHTLEELFESSDIAGDKIAGSLFSQMFTAEAKRAATLPDERCGAWEYITRGFVGHFTDFGSVESHHRTLDNLSKAVNVDPESGAAHALLSWSASAIIANALYKDEDLPKYFSLAKEHLQLARAHAGDDLLALSWLGAAEHYAGQFHESVVTLERVVARNPSNSEAWNSLGLVYAALGRFDEAREANQRAVDISPEGGMSSVQSWYRGLVEFYAGDYAAARPLVEAYAQKWPRYGYANVFLAVCCTELGDEKSAQKYTARAKVHNPTVTPEKLAPSIMTQSDREKAQHDYALLEKLWAEAG